MEVPPAVWTLAPGADAEEVRDLLDRLADDLGIAAPEIKNDYVLLPADYPRVADALSDIDRDWEDLLVPPVP